MICYQPTNNDITQEIVSSNDSCCTSKLVLQRVAGNKLIVVQPQQQQQRVEQQQQKKQQRQVKFSTLTVRSYPRCPGYFHVTSDSGGPPLSMEQKHQSEITYPSIDVYETKTTITKSRSELKVPSMERDELLRRYGYSLAERQQATKQSTITRNQRKKSNRGADGSSASFLGLHFKSFKNKNNNRNKNKNKNNKIRANN